MAALKNPKPLAQFTFWGPLGPSSRLIAIIKQIFNFTAIEKQYVTGRVKN